MALIVQRTSSRQWSVKDMDLTIEIGYPEWDPHPEKSKQGYRNKVVKVKFPNMPFVWIPSRDNLIAIKAKLHECKKLNAKEKAEYFANRRGEKNAAVL
jgi:hypothetical protein